MRHIKYSLLTCFLLAVGVSSVSAQNNDSIYSWKTAKKNIVRYNVSSALLFGFDKTFIIGYERMIKPNQSISINVGKHALPKLVTLDFDSLDFKNDAQNTGFNFSVDYRFYLGKLNKFHGPRGVYVGPYYSFNQWERKNDFSILTSAGTEKLGKSDMNFNINMMGAELGYQFIFWKRLTVDMVLIGPGVGFYNLKAKAEGNLTEEERQQLEDALVQIIDEKFPGMNYVLSDKELTGSGSLKVSSVGFRYLIHIGFHF